MKGMWGREGGRFAVFKKYNETYAPGLPALPQLEECVLRIWYQLNIPASVREYYRRCKVNHLLIHSSLVCCFAFRWQSLQGKCAVTLLIQQFCVRGKSLGFRD